jgi:hypothetical protein
MGLEKVAAAAERYTEEAEALHIGVVAAAHHIAVNHMPSMEVRCKDLLEV